MTSVRGALATTLLGQADPTAPAGPGCEPVAAGFLAEPVAAISSLAFVLAALLIIAPLGAAPLGKAPLITAPVGDGRQGWESARARRRALRGYAVLVGAIGVGSVVQHGPDPSWSDLAHDVPLIAALAFVAADAVADLTARRRLWWRWALPTAAFVIPVVAAPRAADAAQAGLAAVAVTLTLARARARPGLRRRSALALGLLLVGGAIGALSRAGGPLCAPESIWQGHAAWHVLAAAALVVLAPVIGTSARGGGDGSRTRVGELAPHAE